MWPFTKKTETIEKRSSGTGYTAQIMQARAAYITGTDGLAELTGTVQGCVSLWEGGLSLADVDGTDMLTPFSLALAARALALRVRTWPVGVTLRRCQVTPAKARCVSCPISRAMERVLA